MILLEQICFTDINMELPLDLYLCSEDMAIQVLLVLSVLYQVLLYYILYYILLYDCFQAYGPGLIMIIVKCL